MMMGRERERRGRHEGDRIETAAAPEIKIDEGKAQTKRRQEELMKYENKKQTNKQEKDRYTIKDG